MEVPISRNCMRLLTKLGYKGIWIGVNAQGMTHPLEVMQTPRFSSFGYIKGEFLKVSKYSETLLKPSRKDNDVNTSRSSNDNENCRWRAEASSYHHNWTRDNQEEYKKSQYYIFHFDYKHVVNDEQKSWHRKLCSFCGLHNHVIVKWWKRIITRKRVRHENPSPHKGRKHVKQVWRKKAYCIHSNRGGHQRPTCSRLHPEQHLKEKALVQKPVSEGV